MYVIETVKPSCGNGGYIWYQCSSCSYQLKKILLATGNHIYDENGNCVNCDKFISGSTNCDHSCVINSGWRSSSCDEDGYKEYRCLDCNQILEVTVPNIDGHVYYDGEETCGYCGHQKDDLIENGYVTVN